MAATPRDPDAPARTPDALRTWLIEHIAALLEQPAAALTVTSSLRALGLDSRATIALASALGERLGAPVPGRGAVRAQHDRRARALARAAGPRARDSPTTPARRDEPIAVIGAACRLPGGVRTPEEFWALLVAGVDATTEVPEERWDADAHYSADLREPGRMNTRRGGFLRAPIDRFDAGFFGLSPREAAQLDPQQRLALELAWEALEHAGVRPASLRETAAGVFCGAVFNDYEGLRLKLGPTAVTGHSSAGQNQALIANRVSYTLGLQGPSVTVNTACSSSLVAIHLACQSLRAGESSVALAGGVHLMLTPDTSVAVAKFGALAPDGRCKSFDARADGYARGEGGGLVLLKPLRAALRDGDRVLCTILGSAVNNDGASNGLTAPSPAAQRAVLRAALRQADVAPASVAYVEAHGTGTALGDPIEARALGEVYGEGRDAPLWIGTCKTNIGHLEAAAGVAGFLKAALCLQRRALVPSLHFETPNPHIDFAALRLAVSQRARGWPTPTGARARPRAGVSSFGYGGTNAHVILGPASRRRRGSRASRSQGRARWPRPRARLHGRSDRMMATTRRTPKRPCRWRPESAGARAPRAAGRRWSRATPGRLGGACGRSRAATRPISQHAPLDILKETRSRRCSCSRASARSGADGARAARRAGVSPGPRALRSSRARALRARRCSTRSSTRRPTAASRTTTPTSC
ncbi:MAG: hypothetical protein H6713_06235 [Myxococcales bacterium]|nr:hypothetical protein [Myxococcales bacterium]